VGNPNSNAFASSRGIRGGVLQLERGGGLCQASGIIHHLSLLCGFDIIERYNHSKDLYTDETRFCPLGSDATVAYGYRDLRIKNTSNSQIQIDLQVHDDHFSGYLRSSNQIKTLDIIFESIETTDGNIIAKTIDKADGRLIEISHYERLK
jgi:vancomycin resistance protein VanW